LTRAAALRPVQTSRTRNLIVSLDRLEGLLALLWFRAPAGAAI
jgi:hypothetical protein